MDIEPKVRLFIDVDRERDREITGDKGHDRAHHKLLALVEDDRVRDGHQHGAGDDRRGKGTDEIMEEVRVGPPFEARDAVDQRIDERGEREEQAVFGDIQILEAL